MNLLDGIFAVLNGDIKLTYNEFNFGWVLIFILAIAIQAGAEELMCRWFVFE